jgi:hypothetical protein
VILLENDKALTKSKIIEFHHRMKLNAPMLPVPVIIKTVEKISHQLSVTPKVPSEFELELTYKRFIQALLTNEWEIINYKDWKFAPYVFWYDNSKLGAKKEFITRYFDWIYSQSIKSNWRRLIYVYLRDFNYKTEYPLPFKTIAIAIQKAFKQPELQFGLDNWEKRHNKVGLFLEDFDLSISINLFIELKYDWIKFVDITGLDGELSTSGYADAVGIELLKELTLSPTKELVEAVQSYHFQDQQLRYLDRRVDVIQSILSPWTYNSNFKNEELRKKVKNLLIKHFKDPRMPIHREKGWRFVDDTSLNLFFKWMIGESLEQFFSIIDVMALEHQWKYRKAFWKAYYDKGVLDEAWVAFGPEAKYQARRLFGANFSAGELEGGSQSNQSVLILKIRDLVLVEWSHNGKCRAWKSHDQYSPSTNKPKYYGSRLKLPSMKIVVGYQQDGISHQQSETYKWQRRLADFIYDETGVRMQDRDFQI